MKDTMNIEILDENELSRLKSRIHNQREVINRQNKRIKHLSHEIQQRDIDFMDVIKKDVGYEDTIKGLVDKYNQLAESNENLQKLEAQHKRKLIAINHDLKRDVHVALR